LGYFLALLVIHIPCLFLTIFVLYGVMLQVEVDGQVLGKGMGLTWDEAKMQVFYLFTWKIFF
jgi:hypothetical protein